MISHKLIFQKVKISHEPKTGLVKSASYCLDQSNFLICDSYNW